MHLIQQIDHRLIDLRVFPCFCLICLFLKIGDHKYLIEKGIPWGTGLMVCGMVTLLGIATNNGVTDYIATFLKDNVSPFWMPAVLSLLGSFLSCFAGAIMTVYPMLGAIAIPYAAAAGMDPIPLLLAIMVGASATAISPLSSGGALMLSMAPNEEVREKGFNQCLGLAISGAVIAAVLATFVFRLL